MVDHVSRIQDPGNYFVFEAEKESIIIIREKIMRLEPFIMYVPIGDQEYALMKKGRKIS